MQPSLVLAIFLMSAAIVQAADRTERFSALDPAGQATRVLTVFVRFEPGQGWRIDPHRFLAGGYEVALNRAPAARMAHLSLDGRSVRIHVPCRVHYHPGSTGIDGSRPPVERTLVLGTVALPATSGGEPAVVEVAWAPGIGMYPPTFKHGPPLLRRAGEGPIGLVRRRTGKITIGGSSICCWITQVTAQRLKGLRWTETGHVEEIDVYMGAPAGGA